MQPVKLLLSDSAMGTSVCTYLFRDLEPRLTQGTTKVDLEHILTNHDAAQQFARRCVHARQLAFLTYFLHIILRQFTGLS